MGLYRLLYNVRELFKMQPYSQEFISSNVANNMKILFVPFDFKNVYLKKLISFLLSENVIMKVSQIFNVIYIVFARLRYQWYWIWKSHQLEDRMSQHTVVFSISVVSSRVSRHILLLVSNKYILTCLLILCLVPWRIFRCDFHSRPCKCLRHANICTRLPVASRFSLSLSITPCPSTSFHGSFRKPSPDADEERQ